MTKWDGMESLEKRVKMFKIAAVENRRESNSNPQAPQSSGEGLLRLKAMGLW